MRELSGPLLAGLLEAAPDAVVCVDSSGRIALVNAQAERLFGYGREELAGQPVEVLVPDAARAGHEALRAGYVANPSPRAMGGGLELSARRRDGGIFPAEISLSAVETGEGLLVLAAVRDVTERRAAAAEAARLAAIIESSHDAVIGESLDGLVTSWNRGAELVYGYSAAEMVGRPVDVLIPAGGRAADHEARDGIMRGGRMERYQTERIRKDGTTITVSITMSPITDGTGGIVGMSRVTRDFTAGRQRAAARFQGLLEAAPDAVVCVASSGRIALVNAQAERLFGYRREELAGQPVEVLVPDAARAGHEALRIGFVANPSPRAMGGGLVLSARRRDGGIFPAEISLTAVETEEGILVLAAVRDVTERLALEAERDRLRTQAERDRLESLGKLAGGIAHDFNNILGIISNYAAFIGQEANRERQADWQAVREDVQQIEQAAARAAGLTRQLLSFGRREVVRPRLLDLNDVIGAMEPLLARTLGGQAELVTDFAAGLSPILADPGQIERVLVNLAANAQEAMPDGGTLTIRTASTQVDATHDARRDGLAPGWYVSVQVTDTGTGMPGEVAERAFEPFFTTKATGDGPGLGLPTVYGIVAQAGGHVRIRSEAGHGTTVAILLPAAAQAAALPDGGARTVLIVDDEAALLEVARRILARHGYQVITAATGPEAVRAAAAAAGGIDLLLTDVIMPQMLGTEAADQIRVFQPSAKVLFMSGYTQGGLDNVGVLDAGVSLIQKPFTEASLLAKVGEILSETS